MRTKLATLTVVSLTLIAPSLARAEPTQLNVRIEGKTETLFEGPILSEGHRIKASSDTKQRSCDGINPLDPRNVAPGATPTTASVDAMSTIDETFDGKWYEGFNDYFITRWGPDREEEGESWGILVNNVFTDVGGCQYQLSTGDEILWDYNAFADRPFLALFPAGDTSGTRPLTANAELGKPFNVEVVAYEDNVEDEPPPSPERSGSAAYQDADVSPVETSAKGFEKVLTGSSQTVTTNAEGKASITFTEPGWHRIKATNFELIKENDGEERAEETTVRSNRLDVCVPAAGHSDCGASPSEDQVRTPPQSEVERKAEEEATARHEREAKQQEEAKREQESKLAEGRASGDAGYLAPTFAGVVSGALAKPALVEMPLTNGSGAAQGLVGVSWRIIEPGPGLRSWTISSRTIGAKGAGFIKRAAGKTGTAALVSLPPGAAYELEITLTDSLGRSSTTAFGRTVVPWDDRSSKLRYSGSWSRLRRPGAWLGTLSRANAGSAVSTRLPAGRPVFLLRGGAAGAIVEVSSPSKHQTFSVAPSRAGASRVVKAAARAGSGPVTLRVLQGSVDLDGAADEA